jgi:hypothetical protein
MSPSRSYCARSTDSSAGLSDLQYCVNNGVAGHCLVRGTYVSASIASASKLVRAILWRARGNRLRSYMEVVSWWRFWES